MKFLTRKIYLILVFLAILSFETTANSKDSKILYAQADVSNYFSGILLADQYYTEDAFKHLKKAKNLKNSHTNYNIHFIRTLVLLEKFDQAIAFSKNVWREDILLFEADLLIGLDYFIKEDYLKAEKYFKRLKGNSDYELFFEGFLSNILLSWIKFSNQEVEEGMKIFEKIPNHYNNLKKIQNAFLLCYLDDSKTPAAFEELVDDERIEVEVLDSFRC